MKQIIGLLQFILGFVVGVLILAGGAVGAGYYFLSQMASAPPKPTFNQEKTTSSETNNSKETKENKETNNSKETKENQTEKPTPKASPTSSPTPTPEKEEKLPEGAYNARVTWSSGLTVRSEPSVGGSRTGGLSYNEQIIILEEKEGWQKIRTSSGVEGWVKSGNTNKID